MTPDYLAFAKSLYEIGAPATYLFFLIVLWSTSRRDNKEAATRQSDAAVRHEARLHELMEGQEALLRETVESLTRVAEALDRQEREKDAGTTR
jgi:hypothetical protein